MVTHRKRFLVTSCHPTVNVHIDCLRFDRRYRIFHCSCQQRCISIRLTTAAGRLVEHRVVFRRSLDVCSASRLRFAPINHGSKVAGLGNSRTGRPTLSWHLHLIPWRRVNAANQRRPCGNIHGIRMTFVAPKLFDIGHLHSHS